MFMHSSREDHGFRFWWHTDGRSVFRVEMAFFRSHCGVALRTHDNEWTLHAAVPWLVAVWVTFDGFGLWHPQRKCIASWEPEKREFWIPDDRECSVSCNDWTLRFSLWGKSMEWTRSDPWWIRGISLNLLDLLLGRTRHSSTTLKADIPLQIPLPEGVYPAVATIERSTWKRPRWFPRSRTYVSVNVPKGLPFAGKGENSWDCGDDGLYGYSVEGTDLDVAVAHGVESVLKRRRRYGQAIREALA